MTPPALQLTLRPLRDAIPMVVCLIVLTAGSSDAQPPSAGKPVTVANAISATVKSGQTFVGTVTPSRTAVIGSAVDGRVDQYFINKGERVKDRAPLAQLLTETITSELKTAVRDWQLRIAELQELDPQRKIEIDEDVREKLIAEKLISESEMPDSRQVSAASGNEAEKPTGKLDKEIAEAKSLRKAAAASVKTEISDYNRVQDLRKRGIATQQDLDEAELQVDLAEAARDERTAAANYAKTTKEFRVNQAVERVKMQEAIVEKLLDQKRKHTIITRFDGYVTAEYTEEGAWVNRGDPVAEVAALDVVDVVANVLESQISYIKKGDPIRVEIPALPFSDRVVMGYIEAIVPQADVRARTFPVLIRVQNKIREEDEDPLIKAGMLARAMLPTGPETKALFVPKDAINLGGQTPIVYVVQLKNPKDDAGKAKPVPVRLGIAYGSLIEVEGELKDGDLVVVRGNERLTPMSDVKITAHIDSNDLKETKPVSVKEDAGTNVPPKE